MAEGLARRVAGRLPPELTGQPAYRLRRLVLEADPGAAAKRHEEAVAEREVVRGVSGDRTAYLSSRNDKGHDRHLTSPA